MGEGKHLVGVDVGSTSIKVCELKESRKGLNLSRLGYVPLPPEAIVDGQVMDAGAVTEALTQVFRQAKVKGRDIAVGVPGQAAIIRKINVPLMTNEELGEQIQWEAEQHIPFDIKDAAIDHQVLRRSPEDGQMEVLLVAAKKDQIEDYVQLFRGAKLRPVVCDIHAFAVQNLFEASRGNLGGETVAIINAGASLSSLNVISSGISAFSREIANGGNAVTDEIQRALGVPREQAEAYKCGDGRDGIIPDQVNEIVEGSCDAIAAEIQRSLDFFMATGADTTISRVFVTGGSAALGPLAQAIEQRSRLPVETWLPLDGITSMTKEVSQDLLAQHGLQFAVALGLALRREREARA